MQGLYTNQRHSLREIGQIIWLIDHPLYLHYCKFWQNGKHVVSNFHFHRITKTWRLITHKHTYVINPRSVRLRVHECTLWESIILRFDGVSYHVLKLLDKQWYHRGKFNDLSFDLHWLRRMWYITWRCIPWRASESLTQLNCVLCLCLNFVYEGGYLQIFLLDSLGEFDNDMSHLC